MKRLPQVGEIWWNREKKLSGMISWDKESDAYPIKCNGLNFSERGTFFISKTPHEKDLLHIHTDATGKVINPTFPGDEMKKESQKPVDPFTIDWPREAFKVGEKVMVKPSHADYMRARGVDYSNPLVFYRYDKNVNPFFIDAKGKEVCSFYERLAPLSEVEKYRAAIGQKPPKPPKPDPFILRRDAAKKVLDAWNERLTLRDKLKANKADRKALLAREAELKAICEGGWK